MQLANACASTEYGNFGVLVGSEVSGEFDSSGSVLRVAAPRNWAALSGCRSWSPLQQNVEALSGLARRERISLSQMLPLIFSSKWVCSFIRICVIEQELEFITQLRAFW
jgi:hypothetical protein